MESVLENHGPRESLERSMVRIGLETTELRVEDDMQIDTVGGGRRDRKRDAPTTEVAQTGDAQTIDSSL